MRSKTDEILPLIYSMEIRDSYTKGHSAHVAYYAKALASVMGLSKKEQEDVYIAGLLHDLGKIGIPDTVLLKPGKLEKDEFELIKQHSVLSADIVEKLPNFSYLQSIVRHHHEDFNGKGYPDGLQGEEIPLLSRILCVVDVFDALTTKRIYRGGTPLDKALEIMEQMQEGGKFDPEIYAKFIPFIKEHGIYTHEIETSPVLTELDQKRNNFFYKDTLTQLLNRTALLGLLKKTHDYKFKVSLVLCDLKEFRLYNQKYGLRKGDRVLQEVAKILRMIWRQLWILKNPKNRIFFYFI